MSSASDYSGHNSSGGSSVVGIGVGQTIYRSGNMHHNMSINAAVANQLHHTLSQHRQGSNSPPLPPPPTLDDEHARFGQPSGGQSHVPIVSDELDLPGWVPKNYIEKGTCRMAVRNRENDDN